MNKLINQFVRILFVLFIASSLSMPNAMAEDGQNFNIPIRLFAVTVPNLKTDPNRIDIPIRFGSGKVSPIANSNQWKIYGGTQLTTRPPSSKPTIVELFGTVGPTRKLIARVVVKYYPLGNSGSAGWLPMYRLDQEPMMIKTPEGWKPFFESPESPEILGVMNRKLPNSAGFRPYIDFKLFKGKASIDSWNVKRNR